MSASVRLTLAGAAMICLPATMASAQMFVEQQATRYPQPALNEYTSQMTVGDIDGDTDLDLLFANGSGFNCPVTPQVLRVFINNGSGFFTDETVARTGGLTFRARGVELGDVEGDGDLDIIVANDCQNSPALLVNNGSGFFTNQTAIAFPTLSLSSSRGQFADVDNDGDLDIYFVNGNTSRFGTGQGVLLINNGFGVFSNMTATQMPAGSVAQPMDCIFGDVDGDLDLDLHIASRVGTNKLYINNGSGVFTDGTAQLSAAGSTAPGTAYSYDFGDMDGDGDLDLLGANGGAGNQEDLLRNNGPATPGTYTDVTAAQYTPNPGVDDNDSKFFDYDNDGDLDVVIAVLGGGVNGERIYTNNGAGVLTQTLGLITGISDSSMDIKVADVTGDGRLDIMTAQGESGSFIDRIYVNMTGRADTRAPVIIETELVPLSLTSPGGPFPVRAIIYDSHTSDRGFHDKGVTLNYSVNGGPNQTVPMKWVGNSEWRGVIPIQNCASLSYFVTARDFNNNLGTGLTQSFTVGTPSAADLSGDCHVNGVDLAMLLAAWTGASMYAPCPPFAPADLNQDCRVNGLDLAMLLASWNP